MQVGGVFYIAMHCPARALCTCYILDSVIFSQRMEGMLSKFQVGVQVYVCSSVY